MSLGDIIDWVEENPQDAAIRIFALERENIILERENAALRKLINEPYQFFRFGHKALFPWGKFLDRWCKRAEKLGFKKEAKP